MITWPLLPTFGTIKASCPLSLGAGSVERRLGGQTREGLGQNHHAHPCSPQSINRKLWFMYIRFASGNSIVQGVYLLANQKYA